MKQILFFLVIFIPFVAHSQLVTEDFETYNTGSFDSQFNTTQWVGWLGAISNADVSTDQAFSGTKSLKIFDGPNTKTDIVALLGTMNQGVDSISFMQYIPSTGSDGGYYNLQDNYTSAGGSWAANVFFGTSPIDAYINTNGVNYPFTPIFDTWVEQKFIFDFTNQSAKFYYGGTLINTWTLGTDPNGGLGTNAINAINFYAISSLAAGTNSLAYYDDVPVYNQPLYDANIISTSSQEYSQVSSDHIHPISFSADVENSGSLEVTNVAVTFEMVDQSSTVLFTETVTQASLAAGNTSTFTSTMSYMPTASFLGNINYSVTITEVDEDSTNNTQNIAAELTITDSTLAKDAGTITTGLGFTNGTGFLGSVYEFLAPDSISSVTFTQVNATGVGDILIMHVFEVDAAGTVGNLIASSDNYIVSDTASIFNPKTVTVSFNNSVPVDSGKYLVAIEQVGLNNAAIAITNDIFTPGTGKFSGDGLSWGNLEDIAFFVTFVIRPNVTGVIHVSTNTVNAFDGKFDVMPNPTSGLTTLNIELKTTQDIDVAIYDVTGKLMQSFNDNNVTNNRYPLDLSNYSNGIYLVRLITNGQIITRRIVLNK